MFPRFIFRVFLFLCGVTAFAQCSGLDVKIDAPRPGFVAYVGTPLDLVVRVTPCGSERTLGDANVVMGFHNRSVQLSYQESGAEAGSWTGSWTPSEVVSSGARLSFFAVRAFGEFGGNQVVGSIQPPAPQVSLDRTSVRFNVHAGGTPSEQEIEIVNNTEQEQAVDITGSGESWLSVGPSSLVLPARERGAVRVGVDPGSLQEGVATAAVNVASAGARAAALVSVAVDAPEKPVALVAFPESIVLTAVAGDLPISTGLNLANGSSREVHFTVSSNSSWLTPQTTEWTLQPAGSLGTGVKLTPGTMVGNRLGKIFVTPDGGPQLEIPVQLTVEARTIATPLTLSRQTLNFSGDGAVDLTLTNPFGTNLNYEIIATSEAPEWLSVAPASGVVGATGSAIVRVTASHGERSEGRFEGRLQVRSRVEGGPTATVEVPASLLVAPPHGGDLLVGVASPSDGAPVPRGQAVKLEAIVTDAGGSPVESEASVEVSVGASQSGNIILAHSGNGHWQGPWIPDGEIGEKVDLLFTASRFQAGTPGEWGTAPLRVTLGPNTEPPTLSAVTNGASFEPSDSVAPGEMVSIFGNNLSDCRLDVAASFPLATSRCGTQALLGGKPMPLFAVAWGQVNAEVPLGTPIGTEQQLVVIRGDQPSDPIDLHVTVAQPGVFSFDGSGGGLGIFLVQDRGYQLVTPENPAHPDEIVITFAVGLGDVAADPGLGGAGEGEAVSGSPAGFHSTFAIPSVQVGDQSAFIFYSGLAPGLTGVYQINFRVPENVPAGDALPFTLTVQIDADGSGNLQDATSKPVTIPIAP